MLRHLHLAVLFALMAFTFAIDLPAGFLHPRQNSPAISGTTKGDTSPTTSPAPPTTTTTTPPTTTPQPPTTTTTQAPPTTTQAPPPSTTTASPSSSQGPSTTSIVPPSSSTRPSSTVTSAPSGTISTPPSSETTITSTNLSPLDQVLTTISFTSDGRLISSVATGTNTRLPTSTSKPGLASGYGNETNTLSGESKKLIGGIVGGIGGALLLAGIGFVVYKMWGRKRHEKISQEEDFFGGAMSAGSSDSLGKEKRSGWGPSSLTSKFSEPLDRYKSPSNQVTSPVAGSWGGRSPNAASNF